MEEKVVCFYCGTVYNATDERCPLCGGTLREENPEIPQPRERITEEERKERQKTAKATEEQKKKEEKASSGKPWLVAALIFLSLAVLLLFWFIADMIGWVPGLEDLIDRETLPSVSVNVGCTSLKAEPAQLHFATAGESLELELVVNASCEDTLYCNSEDPAVVAVSNDAVTEEGELEKSAVFTVTSVAAGTTEITVTCGNQTIKVPVTVEGSTEPTESTTEPTEESTLPYVPELSRHEISMTTVGETVELKVANPVEGAEITWSSSNKAVATVDSKGVVTAVGNGTAEIICSINGAESKVSVTCELKEEPSKKPEQKGAHLETTDATVKVGERFALYLYDANGKHIDDIVYKIDNPKVCEVKNNYVKALKKGTTTVRVIYNDVEYTCIVRVSG